jgi:hypothetical protein
MTRLGSAQECPACGNMLVIPPLAKGFVRDNAEDVCLACGRCYAWRHTQPPTLVCIDPIDVDRDAIPHPPLAK